MGGEARRWAVSIDGARSARHEQTPVEAGVCFGVRDGVDPLTFGFSASTWAFAWRSPRTVTRVPQNGEKGREKPRNEQGQAAT